MGSADSFAAEAFTLLSIGISVIGLRTFARIRQVGVRNFEADDYLMLLAIIPYTIETALAYTVGAKFHGLTNSGMTDEERKALSPHSEEFTWRVGGSKIQIAGWIMYGSCLWVIKSALCAFYFRLTAGLTGYKTRIYIGFGFIASTYIAIICCILFSCRPFNRFWQIYPDPGNFCHPAISRLYIFIIVSLNILTDVYLLAIPIPMLWGARIPKVKKYGLVVLFSGAVFVMVAGLLRCILILKNPKSGPIEGASWAVRESFVAVVTANLPSTWGWMRQKLKPIFGSLLSSNNVSSKYKGGPEPGSIMLADGNGSNWKRSNGRSIRSTTGLGSVNDRNVYIHGGGGEASSDEIIPSMPGITKEVEFTVEESNARK
ncbi:related to integral membrane protein PTH11 [Fusarium fujikuroi IMI 58289]|uniref:Related to integral membrane protein PTH11 n=1 Tax=Gibberella fujikuroi (strain CBS 195.34 / IMI 58289 / NRRL A-6831) TaxID=1279085 RepID=S0EPT7_GIBF5|nr:related to integral membrane protein PTH11 [Fusarium fujikuroi IMI 58289]CCT75720.1 related to integral membrane protein PTH11 [Fusarium fujikuroi IMI 58289]SCO14125.1 related to integral membrane protein PTH11 [Fusarium fujikuroi]